MAKIVFLTDIEEGHLFPMFGLSHALQHAGHEVAYLGIPDSEETIKSQGFSFYSVFSNIYPKGYRKEYYAMVNHGEQSLVKEKRHLQDLFDGTTDDLLEILNPDLLIVSSFLSMEALLIHYKHKIRIAILTPYLRDHKQPVSADCMDAIMHLPGDNALKLVNYFTSLGINVKSLPQVVAPLDEFAEFISCPRELDFPDSTPPSNAHYVWAGLRKSDVRNMQPFVSRFSEGQKIVYASLGSQPMSYGDKSLAFFQQIVKAFQSHALKDVHLVLSVGPETNMELLGESSHNVTITRWVPQIEMLERAELAIIHGGLGTIKECVYFGVPMIVVPFRFDQPMNAKRITTHKLGVALELKDISAENLTGLIKNLLTDSTIAFSVKKMQQVFMKEYDLTRPVMLIEKLISESNYVIK